jgi:hypothetical protein
MTLPLITRQAGHADNRSAERAVAPVQTADDVAAVAEFLDFPAQPLSGRRAPGECAVHFLIVNDPNHGVKLCVMLVFFLRERCKE